MIKIIKSLIQKIISSPMTPKYFFAFSSLGLVIGLTIIFIFNIAFQASVFTSGLLVRLIFGEATFDSLMTEIFGA